MTAQQKLPLALAAGVLFALGLAGLKNTPDRQPDAIAQDAQPELAPFRFISHDWIESTTPGPAPRDHFLPDTVGADFGIECQVPNCRNCQIHRVWKSSF